jgi:hypothetical protein
MKFSTSLMTDSSSQYAKLGDYAKRSPRSQWAGTQEQIVRELAPYPISYDVNQGQSLGFTEYTYTELLGGLWVATQSLEINCRILQEAANFEPVLDIDLKSLVSDKYVQSEDTNKYSKVKRICFLPGHNALDIASVEMIARIAHEEEDVFFKPHPITNENAMQLIGTRVGWNRIIPKEISGNALLLNCEEVYTTSASEMAISGTILGKRVINVSNFFNEGSGAYHPISRILFKPQKNKSAINALKSIFSCPWSGIITSQHTDVEERLRLYYEKTLSLRSLYRPIASPIGKPPNTQKVTL